MRKAATVRNTQVILSGKTPMEMAMGKRPRKLMDPASMNPEQLTSTPRKQDFLNEEIQKLAMKTHLEVQQWENTRRDLAWKMKFVLPDLRVGDSVFCWQKDPSKIQQGRKSGKLLKVEIIAVKGHHGCYLYWCVHFSSWCKHAEKTCGHAGFGCEGQTDARELFSDGSYLSAILDRQGPLVAAPVDRKNENSESFSPQLFQGFWSKLKNKIPKIVVMSPTVTTKNSKQKEVTWKQCRLCLAVAQYQILGGKHFLLLGPESRRIWWLKKVQYLQKKSTTVKGPSCVARKPSAFFIILAISDIHLS